MNPDQTTSPTPLEVTPTILFSSKAADGLPPWPDPEDLYQKLPGAPTKRKAEQLQDLMNQVKAAVEASSYGMIEIFWKTP